VNLSLYLKHLARKRYLILHALSSVVIFSLVLISHVSFKPTNFIFIILFTRNMALLDLRDILR